MENGGVVEVESEKPSNLLWKKPYKGIHGERCGFGQISQERNAYNMPIYIR